MIKSKKGISLISLIITIIVIIILAAIVIFEGFGATESAEFARFAQEFSDYQERISQEYRNKKTDNVIDRVKKKDSEIYSEMGNTAETVLEVLAGVELQEPLNGTNCYRLTPDREIYDANERVYVTDKGEVFTLPGYEYEINGETRYYVTSSKYYIGDGIVTPGENPPQVEMATTLDSGDSSAEMWALLGAIANKISNTGSINSNTNEATVTLNVNGSNKTYTIRVGDTFKVAYNGTPKTVRIMGFNHDTLASNPSKKAGISFEFVDFLMITQMHNVSTNANGWITKEIYGKLNSGENATWKSLSNSGEIKEVKKNYMTTYSDANSVTTSNDKLWLLACSEIWNDGSTANGCTNGYALGSEGAQYKYYKEKTNGIAWNAQNNFLKKPSSYVGSSSSGDWWWLRSPYYNTSYSFCYVGSNGSCNGNSAIASAGSIAPGFSI